eukprot:6715358-Alexandrium_andersonii.AAC.1
MHPPQAASGSSEHFPAAPKQPGHHEQLQAVLGTLRLLPSSQDTTSSQVEAAPSSQDTTSSFHEAVPRALRLLRN